MNWVRVHAWFLIIVGAILFWDAPIWALGFFLLLVGLVRLHVSYYTSKDNT